MLIVRGKNPSRFVSLQVIHYTFVNKFVLMYLRCTVDISFFTVLNASLV